MTEGESQLEPGSEFYADNGDCKTHAIVSIAMSLKRIADAMHSERGGRPPRKYDKMVAVIFGRISGHVLSISHVLYMEDVNHIWVPFHIRGVDVAANTCAWQKISRNEDGTSTYLISNSQSVAACQMEVFI